MEPQSVPEDASANVLHGIAPPNTSWSSINLAEAIPGVMTPLSASLWVPASERGLREPFVAMGALARRHRGIPNVAAARITNAFFGRMAVRVDFLCEMGDLIPGQSGEALARDFFGFVPPDFVSSPSNRRLPFIVARYPWTLATIGGRIKRLRADTDRWWRHEIQTTKSKTLALAQRTAADARDRFFDALAAQAVISATLIQPLQEQITTFTSAAGVDPAVLLRGAPHEESAVLHDLWAVSRENLSVTEFLRRHGYHGPGEGELENRVWREDLNAVNHLADRYRAKPESQSPDAGIANRDASRISAERTLLSAQTRTGSLRARFILMMARRCIPLRGTGKVAYLQCLDVMRANARHIGALLVQAGRIENPDDAFYFTVDELTGALIAEAGTDLRDIIATRRQLRERYQSLVMPSAWTGQPEPSALSTPSNAATSLTGIGACSGIIEGRAVVVDDPAEADIEDGDILIAHTTDPSWVSLMFLSTALVVDIGGMMSHAAVVARELGIPCVMNTGNGTSVFRTGDLIRVDGSAGTVEKLTAAAG